MAQLTVITYYKWNEQTPITKGVFHEMIQKNTVSWAITGGSLPRDAPWAKLKTSAWSCEAANGSMDCLENPLETMGFYHSL